jgi:hypothetical protein
MPEAADWLWFLGGCAVATTLLKFGLDLRTDWSRSRRLGWVVVFALSPLAALLFHRSLVATGWLALSA